MTLKAPSGGEIVFKTYLTGREERAIRLTLFTSVKIDTEKIGQQQTDSLTGLKKDANPIEGFDLVGQAAAEEEATIAQTVVTYAGSDADIVNRLLDDPNGDYDFALVEAKKVRTRPKELRKSDAGVASSSAGAGN